MIVFDFDGTLADTWRDLATALNHTLSGAGLDPIEGPQVKAWIGDGALKLLQRALPPGQSEGGRLEGHFERFRVAYDDCCLDTTVLYPGIRECLDELAGESLAIASNKPRRFLEPIVEGLGIGGYFFAALGGDSLPVSKPDPGVLRHLSGRLEETPSEVWMVGDSALDVRTGRAAGARTIGCAWGLSDVRELREAGADFVLDHPRQIAPAILG